MEGKVIVVFKISPQSPINTINPTQNTKDL